MNTETCEINVPLVEELEHWVEPVDLFSHFSVLPHCVFLDSATQDARLGRYSYLAADPFHFVEVPADGSDGLSLLENLLGTWPCQTISDLPPFQGGAAGLLSYDLAHSLENLPRPRHDEFSTPAMAIGLYDVVISFDHLQQRAWILSSGFPEPAGNRRHHRAIERLRAAKQRICHPPEPNAPPAPAVAADPLTGQQLAPQHPTSVAPELTSTFTAAGYQTAVEKVIEYIRAGDVFQVNLSQRLLHPMTDDSASLYLRLRDRNPAPFAGYFDLGTFQIISASPERFLQVRDRSVEARPIKGTRPRINWPEADLYVGEQLEQSEKDRAENVMIVDLLRNDLSRSCQPDSLRVSQLCQLETFQYVQHLVSAVTGKLADDASVFDLLRGAFPGGSITGAPKLRAMEIIAELEPTARGAYCGSLGYLGFNGSMDLSILIRTILAGRGWWQFPVGGGIVAQSIPIQEYEETWHKAEGLLRAVR
jgi:para-aminobenzoate synthetase component 1